MSTHSGEVSRESTSMCFMHAKLNGLEVFAAEIGIACLQAQLSNNHCAVWSTVSRLWNIGKENWLEELLMVEKEQEEILEIILGLACFI